MKLLLITSIAEYSSEVKQILKSANVKTYSYRNVIGYRNTADEALESNWFGGEMYENESILFYAFVPKENTDLICSAVAAFNVRQETLSHIHVAVLKIEKTN